MPAPIASFQPRSREAALDGHFTEREHVHVAWCPPLDGAVELFESLRRSGCSISLDVGWHEMWLRDPRALALLRHVDVFFPNETEAQAMTGAHDPESALACFRDAGARGVALKLGAAGAAVLWDGTCLARSRASREPGGYDWRRRLLRCWISALLAARRACGDVFARGECLRRALYGSARGPRRIPDSGPPCADTGGAMRKVSVIGGGGVRTPLLIHAIAQARELRDR